jgi:hypothetical protein
MTYLETFFKIELIASTLLILVLLFLGITKKDKILSETGLNRLRGNWATFKEIFYLSFAIMVMLILLLALEFVEVWQNEVLHSLYHMEIEVVKISLVTVLFVVNFLNLRLVFLLIGGEK